MTAQELIDSSLRLCGVLASGETPSTAERDDALIVLNHLVTSWNAQALPIYQITRTVIAMTGAASYTLGTRPMKIKAASVVVTASGNLPLKIATPQEWADFTDKGTGDYGELLFYADGYPTGTVYVAPRASGTLELICERPTAGGFMRTRETFSLTGAASYTMGVGGTFAAERPARIVGASVLTGATLAQEARVVSAEAWAAYAKRGASANFADVLWYDGSLATPTIYLAPKPGAGSLELYTYEKLATFATLATSITLPDGYEHALRHALAATLAPEYGRAVTPELAKNAEDAKLSIFGLNQSVLGPPQMADPALVQAETPRPPAANEEGAPQQ